MIGLALGVLVGAWVFVCAPARYTASTSLLVSARPDTIATLAQVGQDSWANAGLTSLLGGEPIWLKRLQVMLQSRRIAARVARKYELHKEMGVDQETAASALLRMTKVKLLEKVGVIIQVTCRGPSRLQSWLGRRPSLTHEKARQLCADLANEYAAALDAYATEMSVTAARETREFIEKRKQQVSEELARTEDRLQALQTTNALIDPENKAAELVELTKAATTSYSMATTECDELAHSLETARAQLEQEDAMRIAQEVTARNPVIAPLEEKLAALRVQLATGLESGKVASHPDLMELQSAIDSTEQQINDLQQEVRQQVSRSANPTYDAITSKVVGLEVALSGAKARKATCAAQLAQAKGEVADLPPVLREYVVLSRQAQLQSEVLATLARPLELAAIEEQRESSRKLEALDPAVPPRGICGPSSVRAAELTFIVTVIVLSLVLAQHRGLLVPRLLE